MFAPLARRDQRDKGETYVRGLLLDGRRKSMQPMGERLGVDHQGLQQFVSSSTWAAMPQVNEPEWRGMIFNMAGNWPAPTEQLPDQGLPSAAARVRLTTEARRELRRSTGCTR